MGNLKTVVCVFGVRKKKVIFESHDDNDRSDSYNLKEALRTAAKTDSDLNNKLSKSTNIVLQMKDPSFADLGPIDIEEDEIIPHGSVVHVEFESSFPDASEFILFDENGKQIGCDEKSSNKTTSALPTRDDRISTPIPDEQELVTSSPKYADIDETHMATSSEVEGLASLDTTPNNSTSSSRKDLPVRKTSILYPSPLPSIQGTPLEEFVTPEAILLHLDDFVQHWDTDLSKRTDSNPLPSNYKNYALNIIDTYSFLGRSIKNSVGHDTTTVITHRPLARKLSSCLRNRKHWPTLKLKRKALQKSASNSADDNSPCGSISKPSKRSKLDSQSPSPAATPGSRERATANRPSLFHPPGTDFQCSDAQHKDFVSEIERTKDTNHKKLLVDATRARRRTFVKEALSLPAIVKEYSALQNTEMMLYAFNQVVPSALDNIERNLPVLLTSLSTYFKVPATNSGEEFVVFNRLQEALAPNKTDGNQPVIKVCKAFGSTSGLTTQKSESLKLQVFWNIDTISCAFVVGETLQWEVPQPVTTSQQCISTLMGAYHAFDRCYPFAYQNGMTFLDVHLLELSPPSKPHAKYIKFEQLLSVSKK